MNCNALKPLALGIGIALFASACAPQAQEGADTAAPTAIQPPAAGASAAFDVSELDPDIDACTDFNGFVNARWVEANPIPADQTRWGAFDELRDKSLEAQHRLVEAAASGADAADPGSIAQKIGWLYRSGMDMDAVNAAGWQPIRGELEAIAALASAPDIVAWLNDAFARGAGQVFSFGSGADFKNAKRQIAFVFQSGLGLPTPDYYLLDEHADTRAAYVDYLAGLFELVDVPADEARERAQNVLGFETRLAEHSVPRVELRKPENQYHFVSVEAANQVTPHFDWSRFFAAQGVDVGDGFSLSQPGFAAEFDAMLAEVPAAVWRDYLSAHVISDAAPYLSAPFIDQNFAFYGKTLSGQQEQKARWKQVVGHVNAAMGQALGQLYVAEYFPPEAQARAQVLVDNVRAALKTRIEQLDWMGAETKEKAIAKWETFLPKIGYPETWRTWDGLEIDPGNFYASMQAARAFNDAWDVAKIGQPTDRHEWFMTPQTVNAYYNPTDNTINFPAGILQPPFFVADGDDAVNYGGIGAVIGHEAIHGFDDKGSQFDGGGNLANWWTAEDRAKFDARTALLVQQFNDYVPLAEYPDKHVNGELTLGENIADLGGLSIAYDALQTALQADPDAPAQIDGYTPDQRFFMNWARVWRGNIRTERQLVLLNTDPHAPAKFRAAAAPSNMPSFAAAFSCKAGDAMVRPEDVRVRIW